MTKKKEHNSVYKPMHYEGDGKIDMQNSWRACCSRGFVPPVLVSWWKDLFKYVWRWPYKALPKEDLLKIKRIVDIMLEEIDIIEKQTGTEYSAMSEL